MQELIEYSFSKFKGNLNNLFKINEEIKFKTKKDDQYYSFLTKEGEYLDLSFKDNDEIIFKLSYKNYQKLIKKFYKKDLEIILMEYFSVNDFLLFETRFVKERWIYYKYNYLKTFISFLEVNEYFQKGRIMMIEEKLEYFHPFLIELMDEIDSSFMKDLIKVYNEKWNQIKTITKMY